MVLKGMRKSEIACVWRDLSIFLDVLLFEQERQGC